MRGHVVPLGIVLLAVTLAVCGDGSSSGQDDPARFCELDLEIQLLGLVGGGTSPAEVEASIEAARPLLEESAEVAPAELAEDYGWYVDWQFDFFDLMGDAGYDRSRIDQEAAAVLTGDENRQRFDRAISAIAGWVNGNCAHGQPD